MANTTKPQGTTSLLRIVQLLQALCERVCSPLHQVVSQVHEKFTKVNKKQPITDFWLEPQRKSFEALKTALTTTPILGFPDFDLPFIVETDASLDGLGAVLSQQQPQGLKVIAYASRLLRPNERNMKNYSAAQLELLALKWAVTYKFRGYLLGTKFVVYTDNNPLSYVKTAKIS